ncbi:copper resistance protein CopC [Micromonospora halotolerans]|uniref:Copper resistance protein CopC n=1 Tax=Micromonospora halotolerans TaxID=709879 RepID=A0ABY9ZQR6_9ACTN|nr:copper resistance protein CopC [Micromonospora halotolerans]WNM37330.1 copper resistance protein CopC [Micromonospora halotolerans]
MEEFMGGRVRVARGWSVVLGVVAAVSVLLPAAPAAAHNSLTGSDPKNGARLATAPKRVELTFLAAPAPATTKITITGPDNVAAAGGAPTFAGKRVSVPFTPGEAGLYIVAYRVGSTDGHPVSGEIRFTLTTGTAAAPPSATPAATGAAPSTPPTTSGVSPTPAADEAEDDGGTGWLWAVGAAVVLVALGAGLLLRRRSTRG